MNTENAKSVTLKGSGKGFKLTLDPSMSENSIKNELSPLFNNLKHLANNAKITIDTKGIQGYNKKIDNIKTYLKTNYKVGHISILLPENEIKEEKRSSKPLMFHRSEVLMLKGRIRSGQKIESKKHIIIAGDVNPGAEITSGGDVIVLGRLKGKVNAGVPDKHDSIIFALEFDPTQIQISNIKAVGADEKLNNKRAEFASVDKNKIIVQDYLKANPFAKIPWPEVV
jgi:septum site-determining protein MinC